MTLSAATLQFIKEHQHDNVRELALQARKYPDVDMPFAITQIAGRQAAADKIPSWSIIDTLLYPKHLSMPIGLGIGQNLLSMGAQSINVEDFAQAIKDVLIEKKRLSATTKHVKS